MRIWSQAGCRYTRHAENLVYHNTHEEALSSTKIWSQAPSEGNLRLGSWRIVSATRPLSTTAVSGGHHTSSSHISL